MRERAHRVIPGGIYGHNMDKFLWPGAPQFWSRAHGALIWDADGKEYVDLMCSWGPIVHGHNHPVVEAAAATQRHLMDTANGPGEIFVELAELLVGIVSYADWAVFAKSGTDVTTLALMLARAATGRRTVLVARRSFHGTAPWCNPRDTGTTPGDRAHIAYFEYNDPTSLHAAAAAHSGDVAAVILTPHSHPAAYTQEEVREDFARGVRRLCDTLGACLILDEVRTGFRVSFGSSWDHLGIRPDLSCWSKAIANGYPVSALLGTESLRDAARQVYIGGTFWTSAVPMAAAVACITLLQESDGVATMAATGQRIVDGIRGQAESTGIDIVMSGPPAMPYIEFRDDDDPTVAKRWAAAVAERGVYLNPTHNWFISTALDEQHVDRVLDATAGAFDTLLHRRLG